MAKTLSDLVPFAVGIGTMTVAAHVSAVGAAFPVMAGQLGASVAEAQWVLTVYTLSLSVCLLAFGRVGDRIGFRRLFVAGMALFGLTSCGCALVAGVWALVLLRAVQGMSAAMVAAASIALLAVYVPRYRLARALGWQIGMTCVGLTLGPALGGLVAERFGWRWLFLMNAPLAAIAIAAISISTWRGEEVPRNEGLVLPWQIFRSGRFSAAIVGEGMYYLCLYAAGFLMPFYLMKGRGLSAGQAGLMLGVQSAARAVAAPCSGRLTERYGAGAITCAGVVSLVAALGVMSGFNSGTTGTMISGGLILMGAGTGLFVPANSRALLGAAPEHLYGLSSGFLATARSLGMALGTGFASVLFRHSGSGARPMLIVAVTMAAMAVVWVLFAGSYGKKETT